MEAVELYVAPNGNGANHGTKQKPFATLYQARDAIRKLKEEQGKLTKPIVVMVRGGMYYLDKPLIFTPTDSGTKDCPIIYQAYPDEKPVISGGNPIKGWKQDTGTLWSAEIPEVKAGDWYFYQLFADGNRKSRSRIPNTGYLRTEQTLHNGFDYKDSDIKQWNNLSDVTVTLMSLWTNSSHYIESVDFEKRYVQLDSGIPWGGIFPPWEKHQRYYIENTLEGVDSPGEWYLDRKTGRLTYYPIPAETVGEMYFVAPKLKVTLVRFDGKPEDGKFIEYLNVKGLSFQHADSNLGKGKIKFWGQAAYLQEAAIMATGLRHSNIEDCEVAHVGEHGIWLRKGCKDNRISRCSIYDLGAGGIRIGEGDTAANEAVSAERNIVDNNLVYDGAKIFHGSAGVWIGRSSYNEVTHNEVFDFEHIGISVGWQWGYQPTTAHHNVIEYNHVHHIGHGVLSDMGGIYLLGTSPGTTVRYNLIHDVKSYPKYYNKYLAEGDGAMPLEAAGIYPDEGCSEVLFEGNIIYNITGAGFSVNYCRDNIVRNNIFALCTHAIGFNHGDTQHQMLDVQRNIMLTNEPAVLFGTWSDDVKRVMDNNLFWTVEGDGNVDFYGSNLKQWQKKGNDTNSIVADPLFIDLKNYDFRLKPDSPAYKLGFKLIDSSSIGLYGDEKWSSAAGRIVPRPDDPLAPLRQSESTDDSFERSPAGSYPLRLMRLAEKDDKIHVTDETAASGKHCLKIVNTTSEKDFWPYMYYEPNFEKGKVLFSCDIMSSKDKPCKILIQMRDWQENPHFFQSEKHPRIGPSLRISPTGQVSSKGEKLCDIPLGQWVHVEMTLQLGKEDTKTFVATLTPAGHSPRKFTLPYLSKKFSMLTWLGFAAAGNDTGFFYIDNIKLKCVE